VCPASSYVDASQYPYCPGNPPWFSGPIEDGNLCCYYTQTCIVGRPLMVSGELRLAPSVSSNDWCGFAEIRVEDLDPELRERVANAWLRDAQLEHASVAAFARLTLELLALGAPPDLVAASQDSSVDEILHAQLCYGVASRFAGRDLGPGRLPVGGALGDVSLEELARSTFEEGCVGETVAALVAATQARTARDPELVRVLERIAEDESRHAAFAWRVVRWAVKVGGKSVAQVIERELERALAAQLSFDEAQLDTGGLARFGRLSADELGRIRQECLRDVVTPCLRTLLSTEPAEQVAHV
jgi:hypothetical protein